MPKKILSLLVALLMVLALVPASSLASGENTVAAETLYVENAEPLVIEPEKTEEEKGTYAFATYDFEYSSESEFGQEWNLSDGDGDDRNWQWFGYGINYNTGNNDSSSNLAAHGIGMIASCSYDNTYGSLHPDNWAALRTGVYVPNGNPYLSWFVSAQDQTYYAEHYGVYIGTSANTNTMTLLYEETLGAGSYNYAQRTVDLSAYIGQTVHIAFRHFNCSGQFWVLIDAVELIADNPGTINSAANPDHGNMIFNTEGEFPWIVDTEGDRTYVRSSNSGQASTSSSLTSSVIANAGDTLTFDYKSWGESFGTYMYDVSEFRVDGCAVASWGELDNDWTTYTYTFDSSGYHELEWLYYKDNTTDEPGDYFAVDEVYLTRVASEDLISACYFEEDPLDGSSAWTSDWHLMDNDGDGRKFFWLHGEGAAPLAYEGYGIFVSQSGSGSTYYNPNNYAIYGPVTLRNYNNTLSFYAAGQDDSQVEHFRVMIGTSLSGTYSSVISQTGTFGSYAHYTANLNNYAGQTVYILFQHYNSANTAGMLRLDMLEVRGLNAQPTDPPAPTDTPEPTVPPTDPPAVTLDVALNDEFGTIHFENDANYPWQILTDGDRVYAQSGNAGVGNSTSSITAVITATDNTGISFEYKAWGEGADTSDWDKCRFYVDGELLMDYGQHQNDWQYFFYDFTEGTHTLTWTYKKDSSVNPSGDYFAVDNVQLYESLIPPPPPPLEEPIASVNVSGFVVPEFGADASLVTLDDGQNCSFAGVYWHWWNGADGGYPVGSFDDPDLTYYMSFWLLADYGYTFSDQTVITIDGSDQYVDYVYLQDMEEDGEIHHYIYVETVEFSVSPYDPELDAALNAPGGNIHFMNDETYPWIVLTEGDRVYAQSGNAGQHSTTSSIYATVEANAGDVLRFDYKAWGEGNDGSDWDMCRLSIDGQIVMDYGIHDNDWESIEFELTAGTHTFIWTYKKDNSVNPLGDYFAIDNVYVGPAEVTPTPTPTPTTISSVAITGFTVPEWGASPDLELSVPSGEGYYIDDTYWNRGSYGMEPGETFSDPNAEYYQQIVIAHNEGYVFAQNVTVTINGQSTLVFQATYNPYIDMLVIQTVRFTVSNPINYGDIDMDGDVDVYDALILLRHSMGLITLTPEQLANGDINGDGNMNLSDALLILRFAMGLIPAIPI